METSTSPIAAAARADVNDMARQAYRVLWLGFIVAPILAGLDKFLHVLVPAGWEQYLAPVVADVIPATTFMMIVGVVEVVAGIGVALKPRIFAYVVAVWLVGIIVNLLLNPATYDRSSSSFLGTGVKPGISFSESAAETSVAPASETWNSRMRFIPRPVLPASCT